jgi:DNA-binding beta-propeller fold protein YncE
VSHPRIAAFARLADGHVEATRSIEGEKTRIARTMHGIVYIDKFDEIVVTNPHAEAILFFRGSANGEEPPVRVIQGPHTQLDGGPDWNTPDTVAYDPVNDEVYTRLRRGRSKDATPAILVFPRSANGDVPPLRVIRGPLTMLDDPYQLAVDPESNLLVSSSKGKLLLFNRTDNGNVAPKAVIAGPKTGIGDSVPQQIQMDPTRKQFMVAVNGGIRVWNYTDNGDVAPKYAVVGPKTLMDGPRGLALNPKAGEIYVADGEKNMLFTYSVPHFFAGR